MNLKPSILAIVMQFIILQGYSNLQAPQIISNDTVPAKPLMDTVPANASGIKNTDTVPAPSPKNRCTVRLPLDTLVRLDKFVDPAVQTDRNGYPRPKKWGFITNLPSDLLQVAKSPFQKKNLLGLGIVAGTTALLIWQDQNLIDETKRFADNIHLQRETGYKVFLKAGDTKILKIPTNLNTALYQLGEGGTSMFIAGGLFIYGKINKDYRALQTASDLAEGFVLMGLGTQILKRITGRQSPFMSTQPGGKWQPFPSFAEYQRNTPNYDGFPSGHLATMMCTVTILAENYPEKKWIKPVGYLIMGLSGFAMMNTEVHWAGDYPLALALGYVSGKIVVGRHKKPAKKLPAMY
ncbi:phosphatase PAP2 family protein [Pseudoflavitalea sp. G-6-1-2]|uniref:phosphatase PAP2 family protein n=1 Tax=Pseudoflavitalea sp. G-6-1-2 TaxID=2728841 RepID=UPI00146C8CC4|nr:phosphatase PAP2 family protein [Pseudoflavitalea sp. G-6-1-2]NML20302.1 phosphatase PAP2 family protein [Pseudoflavitalea sp. G-6-1-2]